MISVFRARSVGGSLLLHNFFKIWIAYKALTVRGFYKLEAQNNQRWSGMQTQYRFWKHDKTIFELTVWDALRLYGIALSKTCGSQKYTYIYMSKIARKWQKCESSKRMTDSTLIKNSQTLLESSNDRSVQILNAVVGSFVQAPLRRFVGKWHYKLNKSYRL